METSNQRVQIIQTKSKTKRREQIKNQIKPPCDPLRSTLTSNGSNIYQNIKIANVRGGK